MTEYYLLLHIANCLIGNSWLLSGSQDDFGKYSLASVKAAFNAGFDSGGLEGFSMEDCAAIYHALTGADWNEFVAEDEAQLAAELTMNRTIIEGVQ